VVILCRIIGTPVGWVGPFDTRFAPLRVHGIGGRSANTHRSSVFLLPFAVSSAFHQPAALDTDTIDVAASR